MENTPSRDWSQFKMFDVAANLSDPTYKGVYRGKQHHPADFEAVIERGRKYGVQKYLFAAGYIDDALESIKLSRGSTDFYATIGVHPCRATEPFADKERTDQENLDSYFNKIREILADPEN